MRMWIKLLLPLALLSCVRAQAVVTGPVRPGIEVLRDRGFAGLEGKRVALLTNPSGVDRELRSTADILYDAPQVNLVALFAPEHGVRGNVYAGAKVDDTRDERTGLPVHSLYGSTRQPTARMLEGIDVVVYDIQDVGSRSYTFISTLGLMMRSCATMGIEVMVLDRPNPLGGRKIEGAYVQSDFHSFVGQYRIPYIYGLTVGELATLINEEGLNRGQNGKEAPLHCHLTVIPMEGWHRDMTFDKTGLPWVPPSPNIPYPQNAVNYPCAGLAGEFYGYLNIGIGYTLPFSTFAAEWIDADALKKRLDAFGVPGVAWRPIHYTPSYGSSAGKLIHGVQFHFTDYDAAPLTKLQFYVIQAVWELYKKNPFEMSEGRLAMFDKVCGTDYVRTVFGKSLNVKDLFPYWDKDVDDFRSLSKKYYIYD
ncbi:MAG: DUF1343 domain-containing protein [Bacteroidales bacterium]|nr:DUF1343 domain-containing protein [Bacteroidales bacterium]